MNTDFDRIVSSQTVDRKTARVMGPGVHWTPGKKLLAPGHAWSDLPLPVLPVPAAQAQFQAIAKRLIGLKVDRLTVIGYGGPGAEGARWVVRCSCGAYGHQRTKFLSSERAKRRAMCPQCDYVSQLRAGNVACLPR